MILNLVVVKRMVRENIPQERPPELVLMNEQKLAKTMFGEKQVQRHRGDKRMCACMKN